jgi:hypothetical protein
MSADSGGLDGILEQLIITGKQLLLLLFIKRSSVLM